MERDQPIWVRTSRMVKIAKDSKTENKEKKCSDQMLRYVLENTSSPRVWRSLSQWKSRGEFKEGSADSNWKYFWGVEKDESWDINFVISVIGRPLEMCESIISIEKYKVVKTKSQGISDCDVNMY